VIGALGSLAPHDGHRQQALAELLRRRVVDLADKTKAGGFQFLPAAHILENDRVQVHRAVSSLVWPRTRGAPFPIASAPHFRYILASSVLTRNGMEGTRPRAGPSLPLRDLD
jgi:hypothetical protein